MYSMYVARRLLAFVMDILETIVFIGSIFIVIYLFIMQPNQVKGLSMFPTFNDRDYILTSKITYKFRTPERGDVVVFKAPDEQDVEFIKRVIGVPADTVVVQDGEVYVNGHQLSEIYIADKTVLRDSDFLREGVPITVPAGHLFVMGDNRPRSSDSRVFGFVPFDSIIGVVFYRYFPADKMGFVANPLKSEELGRSSQSATYALHF